MIQIEMETSVDRRLAVPRQVSLVVTRCWHWRNFDAESIRRPIVKYRFESHFDFAVQDRLPIPEFPTQKHLFCLDGN